MPTVLQRITKPTTRKGKKVLLNREPKVVENPKHTLFIKGKNTSEFGRLCLKELYQLKKPYTVQLGKGNDVLPFENVTPIERFAKKYNASLFAFASHNKKRPNNIILAKYQKLLGEEVPPADSFNSIGCHHNTVIATHRSHLSTAVSQATQFSFPNPYQCSTLENKGRLYDDQLLDMIELGIEQYRSLTAFATEKIAEGVKPCILFAGTQFEEVAELKRLQNLLVDFFQREKIDAVRLQGLEHVLMFTADSENKVYMRSYRVIMKKSVTNTPRVELEEIGPSVDFKLRRTKLASADLYKLSCRQPKQLKIRKTKNISRDPFGTKLGRIHMTKQDISKLQTRKMKGLRKTPADKKKQMKKHKAGASN